MGGSEGASVPARPAGVGVKSGLDRLLGQKPQSEEVIAGGPKGPQPELAFDGQEVPAAAASPSPTNLFASPEQARENPEPLPYWPFMMVDGLLVVGALTIALLSRGDLGFWSGSVILLMLAAGAGIFMVPYFFSRPSRPVVATPDRLPKWMVDQPKGAVPSDPLVMHLHWPRFIGEVKRDAAGSQDVQPHWIDAEEEVPPLRRKQLMKEALDHFHVRESRRGSLQRVPDSPME